MMPVELPAGSGFDAAGIVDEVGAGVEGASVGDAVFGTGSAIGLPLLLRTRTGPAESSFHHAPALEHVIEIQQDADFVRDFFAMLRAQAADWSGSGPLRVVDL